MKEKKRIWFLMKAPRVLLRIDRRHKSMMARAPMLSLRICSSCISSQLCPEKPEGHKQVYRSTVSRLIH